MILSSSTLPAAHRRGGLFCAGPARAAQRLVALQRRPGGVCRVGAFAIVFALFPLMPGFAAGAPEPVTPLLAKADPAKGAALATRCKACHTVDKGGAHRFGPALWNVLGRDKAAVADFKYTTSFKKLKGRWDYESLNALIVDPNAIAPGTRMRFPGIKSVAQRADLIRYLRDLADTPLPLPAATEATAQSAKPETEEDFEGLPPGPGREEVFYLCNACHSLKMVTQQGLPRDRWDDLLHWMTEKQGMPALEGAERDSVLDYLAASYGIPADRPSMMTPMSLPPLMLLPPPPK